MTRRLLAGLVALGAAMISIVTPSAQQKKADWLTDGGDPQRTAWQRNETILNKTNVKDMKLLWKVKLDNQPRQMHSLFPPLIAGNVTTADGVERDCDCRRRVRQHLRDRRRQGHAALEQALRQHLPGADWRPRRRRRCVPAD